MYAISITDAQIERTCTFHYMVAQRSHLKESNSKNSTRTEREPSLAYAFALTALPCHQPCLVELKKVRAGLSFGFATNKHCN